MNNQRNVIVAVITTVAIIAIAVVLLWNKQWLNGGSSNTTPTPTVTASPSTPVPTTTAKVTNYTSQKGHLRLNFTQKMYVYDYMVSSTSGWIVVSMNPIDVNNAQANGLFVNYETPNIEGKGGACDSWKSNSVFGQTIQYCEDQKTLSGGYLMNSAAKTEYAFFITAKGVTEKNVYKQIIFNGLTLD